MQTLKDSELRYRRLFEAAQDGILILDARTGMIEDVNPYLIKMLGYSREEFVKKKLWEVGAFKDIKASKDAFEELQEKAYIRYEDLPLIAKDGRLIQVEFISNVYLEGDEKVIQCQIRDNVEHKRIVAALQANEKKYYDLINQSPDGYFIMELSGNILIVNKAMCKELEFSEEEFLSMSIWDIIPEQFLDQYKERLTRILRGESLKEAAEYMVRGKNGRKHYVEVLSAPRYDGGGIIGFQGIARDITARKRAEDALQASEAKFRVLVEHLPTVVYINAVGDTTSTLYVSPQIETLLGYTPQEWLADPKFWMKSVHPEDRQLVLTQAARTDQDNEPFEMEYRMIARDGRLVWVHDQVVLVNDLAGQPQYWQGIMLDITERKLAEAAVYEGQQRFSQVWEATSDAMALSDPDGIVLAANPAYLDLYGYKLEQVVGRSFAVIFPQEIQAQAVEQYKAVFASEAIPPSFESTVRRADGSERIVESTVAFLTATEQRIAMLSTLRDITDRKQAQKALYESEEKYRTLAENMNEHIYRADPPTFVANYVNKAVEKIYGYTVDEWLHDPRLWENAIFPEDRERVLAIIGKARRSGGSGLLEYRIINKRGQTRWVSDSFVSQKDVEGKMVSFNGVVTDITERKKAEAVLLDSEERYRSLFDNMIDGIYRSTHAGKFVDVNPAMVKMFGYSSRQEMLAVDIKKELYFTLEERGSHISDTGREEIEAYRMRRKDGSEIWVEDHGYYIHDEQGKPIYHAGMLRDITERKQAEKTLYESEDRFKNAFQYSAIGMALLSLEGKWLKVNSTLCSIVGYSEEELLAKTFQDITHPDDLNNDINFLNQLLAGEIASYRMEKRYFHRDGRIVWVVLAVALAKDNTGVPLYLISQIEDITERKHAVEVLRENEERFRAWIENSLDVITVVGMDGIIQYGSPSYEHVLGYKPQEITGANAFDFIHPDDRGQTGEIFAQSVQKPENPASAEFRFRHRDGSWRVFEGVGKTYLDDHGQMLGLINSRDITGRKQVEMEIRQRLSELEVLYQSGLSLSQLVKPKAIAQKMIDLLDQEMDWHHTAIRLYHPESKTLELLAFTMSGLISQEEHSATEKRFKTMHRFDQGFTGWVVQHGQTVRSNDLQNDPRYFVTLPGLQSGLYIPIKIAERVLGVISIESDKPNAFTEADERLVVTLSNQAAVAFDNASLFQSARQEIAERKKVEELLADERNQLALRVQERTADLSLANSDLARALRARDEFLASMSHELRTPLTGILGFSETLQLNTYGELSEKQYKAIKYIEESGRHLLDLINDILDLSKIEAGKLDLQFTQCSLAEICQASIQLTKGVAQQKKQTVHYASPAEPIMLHADMRRLKQILVNLLGNAIKFTPENGELGLEVEADEAGRRVRLTVWDKGIGIESGNIHELFKPFVQLDSGLAREYSGTGLGLPLAQRLTELHNGSIEVESVIGKGSRFTVNLPWSPPNSSPIPYAALHKFDADAGTKKQVEPSQFPLVVIVDDNEVVLQMIAEFLETERYRVVKVRSGIELLERVAEIHPDVMLMDIQMPDMDGLETIRRIRAHTDLVIAATPIIAITALAMPGDRELCLSAGANNYVIKPLRVQEIIKIIQNEIEGKP